MNNPPQINLRAVRRVAYTMLAALLVIATSPFLLQPAKASADQLASRSVQLSDSSNSGTSITTGVGSGTNVTYKVTFTSTHQASSMVIDFCSNDPIISDTCTAPAGMDASTATLNAAAVSGTVQTGTDNWAVTDSSTQIKLADDGTSGHDIQAATTESFELSALTNPSAVGSFYARIYTFSHNNWGDGTTTYSSATSVGPFEDYGGVALSTTTVITITARVQETLTFCVTSAQPDGVPAPWIDCSDPHVAANPPALILGHGTPTAILDTTAVDTASAYTQLSTNATHGAVVDMRNSNLTCGGLSADAGTTCAIPAVNAGSATAAGITAGTAAFGLFNEVDPAAGLSTIGSVAPTSTYNNGTNTPSAPPTFYGMETAAGGAGTGVTGVNSTYGSIVGTTSGPVFHADNQLIFAATSSLTTPAGIYTANLSMIATGTF